MNDPFELSPAIDRASFDKKIVRQWLMRPETVQQKYMEEGGMTDFVKYRRWYLRTISKRIADAESKLPSALEQTKWDFANRFDNHFRMVCFSKSYDSLLMWSHYAKNHTGVVTGFNSTQHPFSTVGSKNFLVDVQYGRERGIFRYNPKKSGREIIDSLIEIAGRKSPQWKYENEVRLLLPVMPGIEEFMHIPPQAVSVVIFGCRCPMKHREELVSILKEDRYQHVAIYEAKRSKDRFELEFEPIRKTAMELPSNPPYGS